MQIHFIRKLYIELNKDMDLKIILNGIQFL